MPWRWWPSTRLVALANQALIRVRQRVTREQLGRRARSSDQWANRRLLLRVHELLSPCAFARTRNGCIDNKASDEILAAWMERGWLSLPLSIGLPTSELW